MQSTAKVSPALKKFFLNYPKKIAQSLSEYFDSSHSHQSFEKWMKQYFQKCRPKKINYQLNLENSFEKKVLRTCAQIPYGELRSYSWIARQIKSPHAARAVGQALSKNNLPVLIPCHRVISKNGSLGGYRWGIERKKALIEWEAKHAV